MLADENGAHEKLLYDTATNAIASHNHGIIWTLWSIQWSPDAKSVAFIAEEDHGGEGVLTVVNADTGEVKRVANAKADLFELAWSPSGQVAFPSGNNVALIRAQSEKPVLVAELLPLSDRPRHFAWSPDGILLAAVSDEKLFLLHVNEKKYFDQELKKIDVGSTYAPAWSPDGKRIAFITQRALGDRKDLRTQDEYRLATIGIDGKDERTSAAIELGGIEWSRDGELIRVGRQIMLASDLSPFLKSSYPSDQFKPAPRAAPGDDKRGEAIGWRPER
jgi:dipeptidyl aminopeptidase/acylaminoacyl peptidase